MSTLVFAKLFVIFAVVVIGWAVARSGRLGSWRPGTHARQRRVLHLRAGAALFRTTARIDFQQLELRILLAFFAPTLLLLGASSISPCAGSALSRPGHAAEASTRAITASFGNTVQIGIPLAAALFGEAGLAIHVTLVSLHALTLLTVLTALVELDLAHERRRADPGHERLWRTLATTVRNTVIHPVVLPVAAGLAWNALRLAAARLRRRRAGDARPRRGAPLPGAHRRLAGAIRRARRAARRHRAFGAEAARCCRSACSRLRARGLLGLGGVPLAIVVMAASLPVGSNALLFAQRYESLQAETSTAIVISTIAFVATAPLWLAVLHALGLTAARL